ncbi:MAG: hypothetical protein WBJ13_11840 [Sedimentibacter sp.]
MDEKKFGLSMKNSIIIGVAFVWFTTHFGGGFASGAQIYLYYLRFGVWALIMPVLAMGYNAFYFSYALYFARKHQLYDYRSYNNHFYGKYSKVFSNLFELLYLVIMFLPPAVAFATGGATMAALTGWPFMLCTLIIGVFIFTIAIYGTNVVRKTASVLSVLIIVGLFVVYIPNIIAQWSQITSNINASAMTTLNSDFFGDALYSAFLYGTFQLTNIAVFVQHAEAFDSPKDSIKSNIVGWIINSLMMVLTVVGLFSIMNDPNISSNSVPVLSMTKNGVGSTLFTPMISILIILGAISTAVNMVAAMTKRIQSTTEDPKITREAAKKGKPTKISIIVTLIICILDFGVAQFGLIPLVGKGYSFIAYLTIPIITIPYIVHMIVTNFDRKNPPRVIKETTE